MRSSDERDPPEGGEAHDLQDRSHGTESASRRGLLKAGVGVLGCGLATCLAMWVQALVAWRVLRTVGGRGVSCEIAEKLLRIKLDA